MMYEVDRPSEVEPDDLDLEDIPLIWDISFTNDEDRNEKEHRTNQLSATPAILPSKEDQTKATNTKSDKPEQERGPMVQKQDRNNNGYKSAYSVPDSPLKKRKLTFLRNNKPMVRKEQTPRRPRDFPAKLASSVNSAVGVSMKQVMEAMPILDRPIVIPELPQVKTHVKDLNSESLKNLTNGSAPPVLSPEAPILSPGSPVSSPENLSKGRKESKKMTVLQKYFFTQTEKIHLESYYYGELPGNPFSAPEFSKFLKCPMCAKSFKSNSEIYTHLNSHIAEGGNKRVSAQSWCPYCLESVTPKLLKIHVNAVHHLVRENSFCCQICEKVFGEDFDLAVHMWESHCKLDMPYSCHLCDYRSSMRFQVIDHFYQNHASAPFAQCPICLKVLSVRTEKDVSSVFAHVQLHHNVKGHKCKNCVLVYTGKTELMSHHHRRGAHKPKQLYNLTREVIPYQNPFRIKRLKIPKPPELADREKTGVSLKRRQNRICVQMDKLVLNMDVEEETCLECGEQLRQADHFSAVMSCAKCNYTTCCQKSVMSHYETLHRNSRLYQGMPRLHIKSCDLLRQRFSCECGYQSSHPNRLARHLALCKKTRVFPSRDL